MSALESKIQQLEDRLSRLEYRCEAYFKLVNYLTSYVAVLERTKSGASGWSYTPAYGLALPGEADGSVNSGVRGNPVKIFKSLPTARILNFNMLAGPL